MEDAPVDLNKDGKIDDKELNEYFKKVESYKHIAHIALAAMIVFTLALLTPYVSIDRIKAFSELVSMFYIMMGTLVATYMGVSTWMSIKK
jgi:hypothetical protein